LKFLVVAAVACCTFAGCAQHRQAPRAEFVGVDQDGIDEPDITLRGRELPGYECVDGATPYDEPVMVGTLPRLYLDECSGFAASWKSPRVIWAHNDDWCDDRIFALIDGVVLRAIFHLGLDPRDVEAIAVGPGPVPGMSYIYIGDIGDNDSVWPTVFVYRAPEPVVPLGGLSGLYVRTFPAVSVERIELRYPDTPVMSHRDAETMLVDPLSGDIYIVTKRLGIGRVFRAAFPQSTTGVTTMEYVADIPWAWATDGSVSPEGDLVFIRRYSTVWPQGCIWRRDPAQPLHTAFASDTCNLSMADENQGEAACFTLDGDILTTSEDERDCVDIPVWLYRRTGANP
jgi:hypothetical protein